MSNDLDYIIKEIQAHSYHDLFLLYLTGIDRILEINESSFYIIKELKKGNTIDAVSKMISDSCDIGKEQVLKDIIDLLTTIKNEIKLGKDSWDNSTSIEYYNKYTKYFENGKIITHLLIDVTQRCNLLCKHCYIQDVNIEPRELSINEITNAIEKIDPWKIIISGGEPFLRNDIYDLIYILNTKGFKLDILTNASIINIDKLKNAIPQPKMVNIGISLYSLDKTIHDSFVGNIVHSKILENVENISKICLVTIKTPIMTINVGEIRKIKQFCKERNYSFAPDYKITPTIMGSKNPLNYAPTWDDIKALLDQGILTITNELKCLAGITKLKINANGAIYPCEILPISVGNAIADPCGNIIDNNKLSAVIDFVKRDKAVCQSCQISTSCAYCPGYAYLVNNDITNIPNDYCQRSKLIAEYKSGK